MIIGNYWQSQFMGYTLASGLPFSGMFAYIAGSPHVLIELQGTFSHTIQLDFWQ
jgi:hypothetical protein